MSHTIYGGKTLNGIHIEDMVSDQTDWYNRHMSSRTDVECKGYFLRMAAGIDREPAEDEVIPDAADYRPVVCVFREDDPYTPLYGKMIESWNVFYPDQVTNADGETFVGPYDEKAEEKIYQEFWPEVKEHMPEIEKYALSEDNVVSEPEQAPEIEDELFNEPEVKEPEKPEKSDDGYEY